MFGAMILAAGRGERMRPLSDQTPKPLLRVGEKLLTMVTRVWRSLFAYQIILVAAPR